MNLADFVFLPYPRQMTPQPGSFGLDSGGAIWLYAEQAVLFRPAAEKLSQALLNRFGLDWKLTVGSPTPDSGVLFQPAGPGFNHAQGYQIKVKETRLLIEAQDAAGAAYAVGTLLQMLDQLPPADPALPCMEIADWPDFPVRGVMLDISRDKVYSMQTLFDLIDMLASWKINQLQLYTEHTFAYPSHPRVWQNASPITPEEVRTLDAYCAERLIELVPNQNSFGHMERWLKHPEYAHLAEISGEFTAPWGEVKTGPFSLAPLEPGSIELVASLYEELLPNFTSSLFNVGCDETFDLGLGKSKSVCEELGAGRVYLNFLLQIYQLTQRHGKTMQFWGDIILKYPQFLSEIPRDVIGLLWGYEANHPFEQQARLFSETGLRFYVCPGTSTWNTLAGRTDNALGNLKNAALNGLRYGAAGYLITDWGDNGHWQTLPAFYLGLAAGAAYGWCVSANLERPVQPWLDRFVFKDANQVMGSLAYDLGNADHAAELPPPPEGLFFWPLQWTLEKIRRNQRFTPETYAAGLAAVMQIQIRCQGKDGMRRPDAELIRREYDLTLRMMQHGCYRALYAFGISNAAGLRADLEELIQDFRQVWLERNRPGGLEDSLARLEKLRGDYA